MDGGRFVLARLEAMGLRPSPEAPRARLLRRLSLDLIGLPPTPEEVVAFGSDGAAIISLPWRNYASHLTDNLYFRLPNGLDILIQDELNHPSLIRANAGKHPYPVISLIHHLRYSELRPKWQNDLYRVVEWKYLQSVDGFIFNSKTTQGVVNGLVDHGKPSIVAYPPTDRFSDRTISEDEIRERAGSNELRILFLGNVIYRKGLHILLRAVSRQQSALRVDGLAD